jgi:hypothetical protein
MCAVHPVDENLVRMGIGDHSMQPPLTYAGRGLCNKLNGSGVFHTGIAGYHSVRTISITRRWYVASTIIGATSLAQLKEDVEAFAINLPPECFADVDAIFRKYRDPTLFSG